MPDADHKVHEPGGSSLGTNRPPWLL